MGIDRRKLRIRLTALVVLSILSWPLFYGGIVGSYYRYLLINNRTAGAATLTGEHWGGHAQYNYRYVVGGKEYTGTSRRDYSSEQYRDAGIGDTVPVYYSVDHPSVSSLFVPESVITALPWYVIVFIIWVFFLITVINPDSGWAMNLDRNGDTAQQSGCA
jgi:hypothetical protein